MNINVSELLSLMCADEMTAETRKNAAGLLATIDTDEMKELILEKAVRASEGLVRDAVKEARKTLDTTLAEALKVKSNWGTVSVG